MNIDIESISLLSLIHQDSPKDRQLILCILARSNSVPTRITFNPKTDYPTFYGYSNSRIPLYLMGKGVVSNVPREGFAKRLISSHYLSYAETVINKAKNWDIHQKLMSVSKFITLDNKTAYKDAEVFLIFRDKALDYIKGYATSHEEELTSFLGTELSSEVFKTKDQDEPVLRKAIFAVPTYSIKSREIADQFSPENYSFVLMILKKITSLAEFSTDNEVSYKLQSPFGQEIIKERSLLKKFESQRLFKHLGEDGVFGIVTLGNLETKLIKEIVSRLEEREAGVITSDEFKVEDTKKKYDKIVQDLHEPNQLSELKERYNKILGEIKSKSKNLDASPQKDTQTPISPSNDKVLECGSLKINLDQSTIQFNDTSPVEISTGVNTIKFLIILMENKRVVEYTEIAQKLKLNCYHDGVTNKDVAREVQFLRRDLGDSLVKIGMNKTEIQGMFISKKNVGYKLRCSN